MKRTWIALLLALTLSSLTMAKDAVRPSLVDALKSAGNFHTYLSLQEAAGFRDLGIEPVGKIAKVRGPDTVSAAQGQRTFLVPNDDAFAALPKGSLARLRKDPARLRAFLQLHALPGKVMVADMFDPLPESKKSFASASGDEIEITCSAHSGMHFPRLHVLTGTASVQDDGLPPMGSAAVGPARIGKFQDVLVAEGVLHEIDAVLVK
ncbi:MAG: fasciclin domain-containing protein [Arenimonas sp.]